MSIPLVVDKFAQACERSQDLLALEEEAGLALIFRDICQEQWDRIHEDQEQNAFPLARRTTAIGPLTLWRAEKNTWDLIHRLYFERLAAAPGEYASQPPSQAHPLDTDHALVQRLFAENRSLSEQSVVRSWLEAIAPPFSPTPARKGYWVYTKNALRSQSRPETVALSGGSSVRPEPSSPFGLNRPNPLALAARNTAAPLRPFSDPSTGNSGPSPVPMVSCLDPDAPIREGLPLHHEDETYEADLLDTLFQYIRRGRLEEAIDLCYESGMPWRAASIRGGLMYHDSQLEGTPLEDGPTGAQADVGGTLHRTLWKASCAQLARDTELPAMERAIYAALAGVLAAVLPACPTWEDQLWAYYTAMLEHQVEEYLNTHSHQLSLAEGAPHSATEPSWRLDALLDNQPLPVPPFPANASAVPTTPAMVFDAVTQARPPGASGLTEQDPYHWLQTQLILNQTTELTEQIASQLDSNYAIQLEPALLAYGRIGLEPLGSPLPAEPAATSPGTVSPDLLRLVAHVVIYLRAHGIDIPELAADSVVYRYIRLLVHQVHQAENEPKSLPARESLNKSSRFPDFARARGVSRDQPLGGGPDSAPSTLAEWIAMYTVKLPRTWQAPVYAQYLVGIRGPYEPYRRHALHRAQTAGLNVRQCARLATDVILERGLAQAPLSVESTQTPSGAIYDPVPDTDLDQIRALEWLSFDAELYLGLLLRGNALARQFLTRGRLSSCRALWEMVPEDLIRPGWFNAVSLLQKGADMGLGVTADSPESAPASPGEANPADFDWQLGWDEPPHTGKGPNDLPTSAFYSSAMDHDTGLPQSPVAGALRARKRELLDGVQEYFHYRNLIKCFKVYNEWAEALDHKPTPADLTDHRTIQTRPSTVKKSQATRLADWTSSFLQLTQQAEEALRRLLESDWLSTSVYSSGVAPDTELRNLQLADLRQRFIPEIVFRLHTVLFESRLVCPDNLNKSLTLSHLVADEQYQLYREFMKSDQLPRLMSRFAQSSMSILETPSTNPFQAA
ncbi:Nucleoporin nup84 [Dimargaris cristalligena]|nr:Nucleoporin nup84 [Dimargaris cristalligena]